MFRLLSCWRVQSRYVSQALVSLICQSVLLGNKTFHTCFIFFIWGVHTGNYCSCKESKYNIIIVRAEANQTTSDHIPLCADTGSKEPHPCESKSGKKLMWILKPNEEDKDWNFIIHQTSFDINNIFLLQLWTKK